MAPPGEHDDDFRHWKGYAKHLEGEVASKKAELEELKAKLEAMQRQAFGRKSEKMPPMERETRRDKEADQAETQRKRKERALAKTRLVTETVELKVPDEQRTCPHCHNPKLKSVGKGKPTTVYEYVPGYFRRRIFRRETLACRCGEYIVNAPTPEKTTEATRYGAGFVAHLIVSKCADSIPLYRLEKQYRRIGIPIARSTMTDLFHRNAELADPLVARLIARIAASDIVLADETTMRMQGTTKKAYIWAFLADNLVAYRFSKDRSGKTPVEVLGASQGTLVVDAYTGYNAVTRPEGRERAGCLAHARRKLFEATSSYPEANEALELIRQIYLVEHDARERGFSQTLQHAEMREKQTLPLMDKLYIWLTDRKNLHPPKSKMGKAVSYALANWQALTRFVKDVRLPPDNNRSEAALRAVALGRKNYLFVGNEDAGNNIAGLYSLIATCEANEVNPVAYLRDVLPRLSTHPADRIDELLPDAWKPSS